MIEPGTITLHIELNLDAEMPTSLNPMQMGHIDTMIDLKSEQKMAAAKH